MEVETKMEAATTLEKLQSLTKYPKLVSKSSKSFIKSPKTSRTLTKPQKASLSLSLSLSLMWAKLELNWEFVHSETPD